MRDKLRYLTKMSLDKKFKSKWFYVANIIICIILVGLINIDSIIKFFGGDFDEKTNIIVIDNTNNTYNDFKNTYDTSNGIISEVSGEVDITLSNLTLKEEEKNLKEKDKNILLVIDNDSDNFIKAKVIVNKSVDTVIYQLISASLNQVKSVKALDYYGIDQEKMLLIEKGISIEKISLDDSRTIDENMELFMGTVFPILILPFFMLIIFLVQMIGAEINEEKTTKSMEIIISNVSPATHFTSKLLAGNIFVITQGLLLIAYALLGVGVRILISGSSDILGSSSVVSDFVSGLDGVGIIDKLSTIIPLALILMLVTFVAYSLLAGILASMTTNMEDFQQTQTPMGIVSLLGYYLSMMAVLFDGSIFIRILSYVPFISALLSPTLLALGQIGIIDIIISILLSSGVVYLLYKYGLKIYKVGILNYSSTNLWKKMFKAMKK